MTTVFATAGSLRTGSFNWRLLDRAAEVAPEGVRIDRFAEIGDIPFFSQDREGEATPEPVLEMRRRIAAADAVLIATPEYNGGMPGVLKNALDWASRPAGESPLKGKPAAVVGASPGSRGAVRGQKNARDVLTSIGADVIDAELPVGRFHELADADGRLRDEAIEAGLARHLSALAEMARGQAGDLVEAADYSIACQRLADAQA